MSSRFCFPGSIFVRGMAVFAVLIAVFPVFLSASDAVPFADSMLSMEPIDVTFTFLDRIEYGFTKSNPENLETHIQESPADFLEFPMKWNSSQERYETDAFYFFIQLFTQNSVEIDYRITILGESDTDYIPFHVSILDTDAEEGTSPDVENILGTAVDSEEPIFSSQSRTLPEVKCWEMQAYFFRHELLSMDHSQSRYETTITITVNSDEGTSQGGSV